MTGTPDGLFFLASAALLDRSSGATLGRVGCVRASAARCWRMRDATSIVSSFFLVSGDSSSLLPDSLPGFAPLPFPDLVPATGGTVAGGFAVARVAAAGLAVIATAGTWPDIADTMAAPTMPPATGGGLAGVSVMSPRATDEHAVLWRWW